MVRWPDWRCQSDYQQFKVRPVNKWADLEKYLKEWGDRQIKNDLFELADPYIRRALNRLESVRLYRERLAWEFLRRNVGYQRDWSNWADYRALNKIKDYEKNFNSMISAGQVLREKYSVEPEFEKPPSPFDEFDPVYTFKLDRVANVGLLAYREGGSGNPSVQSVQDPEGPYIDYRIFLDQPIDAQLVRLQSEILKRQRRPQSRLREDKYITYLRILDGLDSGASRAEIAGELYPGADRAKSLQKAIKVAKELGEHGYRWLAGDPASSMVPEAGGDPEREDC
ncbi:MAG: hypothetical protein WCJ64_10535 [Rhodospirillaceae bacterium]